MKRTVTIIFLLFYAMISFGQGNSAPKISAIKGIIKGIIKENTNNAALEYANVAVYALPDSTLISGTITTAEGSFEIKDVPAGKYYVVADFIGYDKQFLPEIEISAKNKIVDCGTITLKAAAISIDEVNITAEKDLIQYKIDKKVVNVDKKLSAKGGTVVDALENTPSIQVDAEGNVSLRGSTNFTVLIDGKPTALASNDALKQIPASAVENVEVITNPSVKYDPDGTSGIINIIMKKEYKTGTSGLINASVGSNWQYSSDFNFNYRSEKVNYYIGGSYADRKRFPSTLIQNEMITNDTTRFVDQSADREQGNNSYSIKGGLDFYLSQKTTLMLSGEYGYFGFGMKMPAKTYERTLPVTEDSYYLNDSKLDIGGNYVNANINLDHKFDEEGKHKIEASVVYSSWDGEVNSNINVQETDNQWLTVNSSDRHRTIQLDKQNEYRTKLDYTYPISEKTTLEAGYQSRFKIVDSDFKKENYNANTFFWEDDAAFNTGMNFHRNIHSVYVSLSGSLIGLNIKAGLRGEYTDRLLESKTSDERYVLDRFDYFPSLHLSKTLKTKQEIQASYSRRINRPQEWNLNPFPIYSDNYISQAGNPDLLPEYIDSYELNIMQRFKKGFVTLEGYYRQTNNALERTLLRDDNSDIITIKPDNLDKNFAYGAELSSNITFTKWFSVYASANVYSFNVQGDIVSENIEAQSLNSDFVLNSNFTFAKTARFQVTGFYNAPKVTAQGKQSEMYGVNLALSNSFFKRKLDVVLRARDVFQTMKFKFNASTPGLVTNFTFNMDSPTIMLSLSYKINNYKKRKEEEGINENIGGGVM